MVAGRLDSSLGLAAGDEHVAGGPNRPTSRPRVMRRKSRRRFAPSDRAKNLGFGVAVRAVLALSAEHQPSWSAIERDVLAGNNVVAADVTFAPDRFEVAIDPHAANA